MTAATTRSDISPKDRRTNGKQKTGRSAKVVNEVLCATCERLSQVGYSALRVDDVAALISELFSAPIIRRLLTFGETVQPAYIESVIDIVLAGAKARI